jgi:hypothetical protein
MPHFIARPISILYFHLRLGLLSNLLPSGFPTKILYESLLSPVYATCPAHLILYLIIRIKFGKDGRSHSSSLCSLLHFPCCLVLFRPKYLPQHPILEHPHSLFLSQRKRPRFAPKQNNRKNFSSMCVSIYILLGKELEDRRFCTE